MQRRKLVDREVSEMKKYQKFNTILNFIISVWVGALIAGGIYKYWDYKTYPDLYASSSAPWYTGIQIFGVVAASVVAAAMILKIIIRKKVKR